MIEEENVVVIIQLDDHEVRIPLNQGVISIIDTATAATTYKPP